MKARLHRGWRGVVLRVFLVDTLNRWLVERPAIRAQRWHLPKRRRGLPHLGRELP